MSEICSHCHIGSPKKQEGTWARMIGPHLILLPGIEAQVCDACGKVEYDPVVLERLNVLLHSGNPLEKKNRAHPSPQIEGSDWLEEWWGYNA